MDIYIQPSDVKITEMPLTKFGHNEKKILKKGTTKRSITRRNPANAN